MITESSKHLDNQHAANVSESDRAVSCTCCRHYHCTNNATETTIQHCWQPTCSNVQNTAFHRCIRDKLPAAHTHRNNSITCSGLNLHVHKLTSIKLISATTVTQSNMTVSYFTRSQQTHSAAADC